MPYNYTSYVSVDNSFYQPTTTSVSSNVIVNDVIIKNLERKHLNSKITCRATNSKMSPPSSATVRIDMTCKLYSLICFLVVLFYYSTNR